MRFPFFAAAAFSVVPFTFAAEPALERLVPADAALVVAVHGVPALRENFARSGAGRAWADPGIARFFAPLAANEKLREFTAKLKQETGYEPAELLGFATGDVLLVVPTTSLTFINQKPDADVLIALEVGDNEARLRELIAEQEKKSANEDGTDATEDYNGVTLHLHKSLKPEGGAAEDANAGAAAGATPSSAAADEGASLVWALHQGRWFLASDRALVTAALDALAAGGVAEPLASSPSYLKVIDRAGGQADALAFIDFRRVYPVLAAAMEAASKANAAPNSGLDPAVVLAALGLDRLDSLSVSTALSGDTARVDSALLFSEPRGLVNLLAYRDGPVLRPDWVPGTWFNVSSQNFSVADAYTELEKIVDEISPMMAGMAQGQIRSMERKLGIELKRDVFGSLGTAFISGFALPSGSDTDNPPPYDELDQFIAVSLADAPTFERALEAIKGAYLPPGDASPLKKRDYLGYSLYTVATNEAGATGFSYAIADGWLLLGVHSAGPVEAVLQLLRTPNVEASFWRRADVRAALEAVPPGAVSLQHTDLAPLLASAAASLVKAQADSDEASRYVDPAAKPTRTQLEAFFRATVSHAWRTPEGLFLHAESLAR